MKWRFEFRPVLAICSALGLAVLVSLGVWQLQRLEWKQDLIAKLEDRMAGDPLPYEEVLARYVLDADVEFQHVTVTGRYFPGREVHVFGTLDGAPGFYQFTPLLVGEGQWVYVNRGFWEEDAKPVPGEWEPGDVPITVTGLVRKYRQSPLVARWLQPVSDMENNIWYERNPVKFALANDILTVPLWIDEMAPSRASPRTTEMQAKLPNKHFEYALTWFGLALTLVVVFIGFSLKRAESSR